MQENIAVNWFNNRKISESVLTEFGVHFDGEKIIIPVLNLEGNFSFNKYRCHPLKNVKPKYWYDKGSHIELYGWSKAKEEKSILLLEGELDVLTAWSHNFTAVTSTGGAMSFQKEWAPLLQDKDVTILFDNDVAGANGMVRALKYLPHAYIVLLPDMPGVKDVTEYIAHGGNLAELLRTRKHFNTIEEVKEDRSQRLALFKSTFFHDAMIEEHEKPEPQKTERKNIVYGTDVEKAREYPIDNLIKVHGSKALCIWHADKNPSMHYYKESNHVYCFSCGKHGDVIDVYRHINNCSFKEAVKGLQ
jgi:DNA primase